MLNTDESWGKWGPKPQRGTTSHPWKRLLSKQNKQTKKQKITVGKDVEKLEPLRSAGECKMVQPLRDTVGWVIKKLNIELPYDTEIPRLGLYPKELKAESGRDICTPLGRAALLTIAKRWKRSKCPLADEWTNCGIHLQWISLWPLKEKKEKEILIHAATRMNLEDIMLSEISQTQKNKYCVIPLMWGPWRSQVHRDRK